MNRNIINKITKIGIISFSSKGDALASSIAEHLSHNGSFEASWDHCRRGMLKPWTEEHFGDDAIIFIGSCGIAVRAIAPCVKDKTSDPAVIVIDELGTYCISLLSGHIGGANRLTRDIASFTGAEPVITTATDRNGVFAVDDWASSQGMKIYGTKNILRISSALLNGKTVTMKSEIEINGRVPEHVEMLQPSDERIPDIFVSYRSCSWSSALHIVPPALVLGVGCRKGTSELTISYAFGKIFASLGVTPAAFCKVCSIDLKKDEPGLNEFCRTLGLPLECFTAAELRSIKGDFAPSRFVSEVTGVDNVCERSAAAGAGPDSRIIMKKTIINGMTASVAEMPFRANFDYL